MRLADIGGRAAVVTAPDRAVDLADASGGRFSPDIQLAYERWDEVKAFAAALDATKAAPVAPADHGNPVPRPRQIFAIGLNYADHARESNFSVPEEPTVFTKFVTCLTGPTGEITLPPGDVDWEVELVAVIGKRAENVSVADGWDHVAGLTVGQDLSERILQRSGPAPQFSLAKSYPGFGPLGPVVVTPDELPNRDDLELGCLVDGEQLQKGRTRDMVFSVPELVSRLSAVTPLLPGDVIFTGTPSGVGMGRTPQRFLKPGQELVTYIDGIGTMRHTFTGGA
ncbi:fumarylacetoacetate hydrolase family protein [Kutzneria sp. CA-103260]|uniref:fumarylacetoacetate hydrolase family protein n=1 Tax=Kutzneria sp. CA-103260 TaxID=2802641 RepID=UPI001BAC90CD|nr:fumarylacetoacetate hydrolase family protein [Kutzneria sp. CA-103260]QUQ62384.1 HpcE protein [Kutzneria sp. CA-103260]